ncbi:MAG: LamG-like jellyroll fold domain-containing protein [Candidatus Paceibacterota bacterium]|jgi:prepilin-type N-terminal cleavage/methylation domain-containing protein
MNRKGFTLIELLVVIAIVGILSSVIYSNITGIRDRARITAGIRFDSSTLHSIGDQLVGEWLFDIPTNPLADTSGMGNNGSTTTAPTYLSIGGYNNKGAYSFDGIDDFINIGNAASLHGNTITITVWVYPKFSSQTRDIYKKHDGATDYWLITTATENSFSFYFGGTGVGGYAQSVTTISPNTWYFIVGTYDGTNTSIYINGKYEGKAASPRTPNGQTAPLTIGQGYDASRFFNGYIDDIRIYSSALSGSEIQKLYASGRPMHEDFSLK